ncbi:hypothetical protein NVP2275O_217 [Vibrio phage 2.275.O._10N.286.54.E11]|nr:hypothetical protein NVP2275O_217 [Vibrio phage 2.275.O._10N.286.54.E11]
MSNFEKFYPALYNWCSRHPSHMLSSNCAFKNLMTKDLGDLPGFADCGIRTVYARAAQDPFAIKYTYHIGDVNSRKSINVVISMGIEFHRRDGSTAAAIANDLTYQNLRKYT